MPELLQLGAWILYGILLTLATLGATVLLLGLVGLTLALIDVRRTRPRRAHTSRSVR